MPPRTTQKSSRFRKLIQGEEAGFANAGSDKSDEPVIKRTPLTGRNITPEERARNTAADRARFEKERDAIRARKAERAKDPEEIARQKALAADRAERATFKKVKRSR